ncbi:hypothetical protein PMAYCL1PPCAC_21961 [Pristionchus mayeri]|uniref:Zinc finger CCCH domain-containing protein 14 n=1 Tax=Pristionchus mayeri TaxID=1317129 RepID=A0AAN5I5W0_9BILA|nr:hypothetical protein PMAYCL1PPCAC_21961 [Pristionchus mayeri]
MRRRTGRRISCLLRLEINALGSLLARRRIRTTSLPTTIPIARFFGTSECFGVYCYYKHPKCPQEKDCTGLECTYEHSSSRPTLLRRLLACEAENNSVEQKETNVPPREEVNKKAKTMRCTFFPQCAKSDDECDFIHPRIKCTRFPSCPGVCCYYLHGACPDDGTCANIRCAYEHEVTLPSLRRMQYTKQNGTIPSRPARARSVSRPRREPRDVRGRSQSRARGVAEKSPSPGRKEHHDPAMDSFGLPDLPAGPSGVYRDDITFESIEARFNQLQLKY